MPQDQDDIKGADAMKQAPTPGPLDSESVKLLVRGDLLLCKTWSVVRFDRFDDSGIRAFVLDLANNQVRLMKPINMAFIGRPDADGWIPWSGGENPLPGQNVEVLASNGVIWDVGARNDWRDPHPFRLAPTAPVETLGHAAAFAANIDTAPVEASGSELLPCPFCGGEAEIVHLDDGDNVGGSCVCCTKCQASGNVEFGRKENFVENWNRRAALRPQPSGETREGGLVAALASYCADDTAGCTDASPCLECLKMANVFQRGTDPFGQYVAELGGLIRPAPVASGGQHSSGEVALDWRKVKTTALEEWRAEFGDYAAIVVLGHDNVWSCRVNNSGHLGFASADEAKQQALTALTKRLAARLAAARQTVALYDAAPAVSREG